MRVKDGCVDQRGCSTVREKPNIANKFNSKCAFRLKAPTAVRYADHLIGQISLRTLVDKFANDAREHTA